MALFLTLDMVALKKEMEKRDAGHWQQREVAIGYCSFGAAYPSRLQRGGNRESQKTEAKGKAGALEG